MSTFNEIGSTDHNLLRSLSNLDERFAWVTFLGRYRPMIHQCMLKSALDANERDEIESQVMLRLVKFFSKPDAKINSSFRGFLARIVENEIHEYLRAKVAYREVHRDYDSVALAQFSLDENQKESIQEIERDMMLRLHKLNLVIDILKMRIEPLTWEIYWDFTILEIPAQDVAGKYNVSLSAVYKYHKRVTDKIREIVQQMECE